MSIILNSDQINATKKLTSFLESDQKYFLLSGSAGTGKTSVIVEFLSNHKKNKIAFCATTNKAVSVLENMMNNKLKETNNLKLRKKINFLTIHKLLKIKRKIDLEGNEIFITTIDDENPLYRVDSKSIYSYDIIVIDEISMMPVNLIEKILKIKNKLEGKIIFVGDIAQLPPVNEKNSMIFELNIPKYQLKNIVRSDGNLTLLSNQIRQLVLKDGNVGLKKLAAKNLKIYRDDDRWVNKYISQTGKIFKKLDKGTDIADINMPIILTYTNRRCVKINKKVRNSLFNNPDAKYVSGDIIVFNNFYHLPTNKEKYYTSQQTYIKSVVIDIYHIKNLKIHDIINIRKSVKELSNDDDIVDKYENIINKYDTNEICNICFDEKNTELTETICGHIFCKKCLKAWFKISETCPLCRLDLAEIGLVFKNDPNLSNILRQLYDFAADKQYKIWVIINSNNDTIMCIHEDSIEQYNKDLEMIKNILLKIKKYIDKKYKHDIVFMNSILTRLWDFYYFQFMDQFANIIYGYAITTHKSQGSTYKNVYIDMSDIINNNPDNKNSHQCLYTAITRASNKVNIYY